MANFDSCALYEAIPLDCHKDEAVAIAGLPPGDYCRDHDGLYISAASRRRNNLKSIDWGFDRGQVVVWFEPDGRVVTKEHRPNISYLPGRLDDSLLGKLFKAVGLSR
jgi:hypothetical protein